MWIKQKTLSLLLAFVTSSIAVPVTYDHNYAPDHEYEPKDYSFSYGVKDLHTGDVKHQWEKKEGDQVRGHYSVLEPDGSVRIVDYTADSKTGFNAVVKHKGTSYHPSPSKPTSHREFELKPSKAVQHDSHDYSLLKDIDDSKSSVTHVDSYGNYVPVKHGYPQEQEEVDHQEVQVETYSPEYKYEYAPEAETGDQYSYEATSHTYEEADYAADSSKYETRYAKHQPKAVKLPVDVNVLKPHLKQDIVPVDVSVVNPIEINLNDVREGEKTQYVYEDHLSGNSTAHVPEEVNLKDSYATGTTASNRPYNRVTEDDYQKFLKEYYKTENINQSQQLSEEEYTKFLKNYYRDNKEQAKPHGSQDIRTGVNRHKSNTYRSNKKPATTPGLRNYSTGIKHIRSTRRPKLQYQTYYGGQKGPVLFPSINRDSNGHKPIGSLYKNPGNLYVRYAKRINSYSST